MEMFAQQTKRIGTLSLQDYRNNPVWTIVEDDYNESNAVSIDISKFLDDDKYLVFFILGWIKLKDNTLLEGIISVNTNNRHVYGLKFICNEQVFNFVGRMFPSGGTLQHLSEWLNKPVEEISPIEYSTEYFFKDGSPIMGVVDLRKW